MTQPVWASFKELKDPELRKFTERLPSTIALNRIGSTVKKYQGACRRWKTWAGQHRLQALLAMERHLVFYLRGSQCPGMSSFNSKLLSPITTFVKATTEGLQRKLAKPVQNNVPVTVKMLEKLVEDTKLSGSLSDLLLITACLSLAFSGLTR